MGARQPFLGSLDMPIATKRRQFYDRGRLSFGPLAPGDAIAIFRAPSVVSLDAPRNDDSRPAPVAREPSIWRNTEKNLLRAAPGAVRPSTKKDARVELRHAVPAAERERAVDLAPEKLEHPEHPVLARAGDAPEVRPTDQHRARAQRQRLDDVNPAAKAPVDHDGRRPSTASTTPGSARIEATAPSSWRPP